MTDRPASSELVQTITPSPRLLTATAGARASWGTANGCAAGDHMPLAVFSVDASITVPLSIERDQTARTSFVPSSASCGEIDPAASGPEIDVGFDHVPSAPRIDACTRQPLPAVAAQTATALPVGSISTSGAAVAVCGVSTGTGPCQEPPAGRYDA